ncbi:hypothetical protein [Acinetobacter calcoaceticus]|uniref:hypothetical protein n=1 Tax=Acinetobacter calcoaceticus TaxID=471 RepID=UPI00124D7D6C|nr:hypothetical protein [Acinetobacter calcoaceticus]
MSLIQDDFTMKAVACFALILVGFGGGGLLGLMIAYLLSPIIELDVSRTAALGAVIGISLALLMLLYSIYSDYSEIKKKKITQV